MTLYRLSLAWGQPVRHLEQSLSAEEITDYQAYYDLEPWGSEPADLRAQQLAYLIAQTQSRKSLDPANFAMPWRKPEKKLVPYDVGLTAFVAHTQRMQNRGRQP